MERDLKVEYTVEQIDLTLLAKAFVEQFEREQGQHLQQEESQVAT